MWEDRERIPEWMTIVDAVTVRSYTCSVPASRPHLGTEPVAHTAQIVCVTAETRHFSTARLARGLIGHVGVVCVCVCVLKQRHGISTGLASSVHSSVCV